MSELQAWVDKLGAMQPDEIRKLMQDEGIQGFPGSLLRCPLASFLTRKVGVAVRVGIDVMAVDGGSVIEAPDSVIGFIEYFDALAFSELVIANGTDD